MDKHIAPGKDAQRKMAVGAQKLAAIVGATLGPDGKNIFMQHPSGIPLSTKDGATVANWFQLEDKFEDMGANIIKFAANKTAAEAGDATTTTTILAEEFVRKGLEKIEEGANARKMIAGMQFAKEKIIDYIIASGKSITPKSPMVKKVAMVSSNYDEEISGMIANVVKEAGKDTIVNIERNLGGETVMDYQKGMTVKSTYTHPSFVNTLHNEVVLNNVCIVLCDYEVTKIKEIGHIFATLEGSDRMPGPGALMRRGERKKVDSYLFIAKEVQGEALSSLVRSKVEMGSKIAIAKAPVGDDFNELIRDLAIFSGGKVIAENEGFNMESMSVMEDCGWAQKIILSRDSLTLIEGDKDESVFDSRITALEDLIKQDKGTRNVEIFKKRIARLNGTIAKLTIGGDNEAQNRERADRAEDAVHAVRSAMEEGIVPGGGVSWLRAYADLSGWDSDDDDGLAGFEIVGNSMFIPIYKVLDNSGYDNDDAIDIVNTIAHSENGLGFNILTGKKEDLMKAGIVDPVKVLRCALENAVTVATQILSTGAAMYLPDDNR